MYLYLYIYIKIYTYEYVFINIYVIYSTYNRCDSHLVRFAIAVEIRVAAMDADEQHELKK